MRKNILVVEDDYLLQKIYKEKFENEGFGVITASNGEECIKITKEQKPDFILLDLMMPKMDGLSALRVIKEDNETKDIPVAILSVIADDDSLVEDAKDLLKTVVGYWRKDEKDPLQIVNQVKQYFGEE